MISKSLNQLVLVAAAIFALSATALAVPRMSMTAGTPCATCHVNPSGSGLRTEIGFDTGRELSLISVHDLIHGSRPAEKAMGTAVEKSSNHFLDNRVSTGIDVRLQWAHLGEPKAVYGENGEQSVIEPEMTMFPMQIQPYLKVGFTNEVSIYGSYAMGPETKNGKACDTVFEGQSCFDVALQYEGKGGLTARGGMIQPSIGMRWDDHTIMTRGDAAQRRIPIIPPNYAEWGTELSYQPSSDIRGELGVYESSNLKAALGAGQSGAEAAGFSYLGRISYLPHFQIGGSSAADDDWDDDDSDDEDEEDEEEQGKQKAFTPPTNGHIWLSASIYGSGEFKLLNGFAGLGLSNGLFFFSEVSHSLQGDDYKTLNGMLGASWTIVDAVVPGIRIERAQTDTSDTQTVVESLVATLEFFPLSFVEVRPEYRIVRTEAYVFGQPTVQLHLYY